METNRKRILVTGATGFLGQSVVKELLNGNEFDVIAIGGRPEDKANPLPNHSRLIQCRLDDLFTHSFTNIDTVVNCAFARSNDAVLLAQALDFTEKLIKRLLLLEVNSIINLSSQGVYKRLPAGELSTEDSPIEPIDLYSMAKFASEKMFSVSSIQYVTNVRLASLLMPQRFLYFFVQKAVNNEKITVSSPNQYAALLDVKDAASGLVSIVSMDAKNRAPVYNLGIGTQYSMLEYAATVKRVGEQYGYSVVYEVSDNTASICSGMDCSRLMKDTGWSPSIPIDAMVSSLFKELNK